jgi:hypothetical protein
MQYSLVIRTAGGNSCYMYHTEHYQYNNNIYYVVFVVLVVFDYCHRPFRLGTYVEPPLRLRVSDRSTFSIALIITIIIIMINCNWVVTRWHVVFLVQLSSLVKRYYCIIIIIITPTSLSFFIHATCQRIRIFSVFPRAVQTNHLITRRGRTDYLLPEIDRTVRDPNHRGNSTLLYPDSYRYLSPPKRQEHIKNGGKLCTKRL